MKAQLKGCHLPSDVDNQPDSLAELIRRAVSQVVLALLAATADTRMTDRLALETAGLRSDVHLLAVQ